MQRSVPFNNKYTNTIPVSQKTGVTDETFYELERKSFKYRKQLRNILKQYGHMSLYDYAKRYNQPNDTKLTEERKSQFIDTFTDEVKRLLGKEVAHSCKKQLSVTYRITTTDHHGPLSEPGMVNSNIHEAIPYLEGDDVVKNVIVLGCANISFDNSSFPRGLLFHSNGANGVTENQLTIYPRAVRPCPIIYFPAYTTQNLENAYKRIESWERDTIVTKEEGQRLKHFLGEIYADPQVLSCKYFSEQVTKTNFTLWKKIMKEYPKAPNLIYIEQEGIVNKLIDKYHLDQDTLIHKLLFTPKYHTYLIKHFDGIMRGFSIKNKTGTYLFWALPRGQKYRVQLWKKGNYLQTEDGSYKIALTPEGIRKALRRKELIPSTLMSFIILSFYYGLRLVGGVDQTTYLTQMKEAFIRMQTEIGNMEKFEHIKDLRTTDLSVMIQSLAFLQAPQATRVPVTGTDFVLYGNQATFTIIKLLSRVLTLKAAFYRALPDCYSRFYKEDERDSHLATITKEDLEEYLGLQDTLVPSAKIG
jgi:hypothetical protein